MATRYLQAKLESLGHPWSTQQAPFADPIAIEAALEHLASRIAQEHPAHYRTQLDPVLEIGRDLGQTLALLLQEDLVLMHSTKAEAMWVCLPSRWNPAQKIGLDFAQIHMPVPHSEKLQAVQDNLTKA